MKEIFSHEEMLELGSNHNTFLSQYLERFELPRSVKELESNILVLTTSIDEKVLNYIMPKVIEFNNGEEYLNFFIGLSAPAIEIIDKVFQTISAIDSFDEISLYVFKEMESVRKTKLSIIEINIIQTNFYIMAAALRFWTSEKTRLKTNSAHDDFNDIKPLWSWRNAAAGDGLSAGMYFLGVGLTIIAPPAGLAVLTSAAWAAAGGSLVAGSGILQ